MRIVIGNKNPCRVITDTFTGSSSGMQRSSSLKGKGNSTRSNKSSTSSTADEPLENGLLRRQRLLSISESDKPIYKSYDGQKAPKIKVNSLKKYL